MFGVTMFSAFAKTHAPGLSSLYPSPYSVSPLFLSPYAHYSFLLLSHS